MSHSHVNLNARFDHSAFGHAVLFGGFVHVALHLLRNLRQDANFFRFHSVSIYRTETALWIYMDISARQKVLPRVSEGLEIYRNYIKRISYECFPSR
jgi:hypothetical protein